MVIVLDNLCLWHSGTPFLLKATKALLEKVNSHIQMSSIKTDCREVINCLTKCDMIYVLDINILILIDSLLTHKPLLCP